MERRVQHKTKERVYPRVPRILSTRLAGRLWITLPKCPMDIRLHWWHHMCLRGSIEPAQGNAGRVIARHQIDVYSKSNSNATALPLGSSTSSIKAALPSDAMPFCKVALSPRYSVGRSRRMASLLPFASDRVIETTG